MGKITVRFAELDDIKYIIQWLMEPGVLRWFPMQNRREVEDSAKIWISYVEYKAVLMALFDGEPCGITNFYIQPFQKLSHQALFAIVVSEKFRSQGVGTALIKELMKLGKQKFKLEYMHLEVYEHNPAYSLYKRLGFKEFGRQKHFIKDNGQYLDKIYMQKKL